MPLERGNPASRQIGSTSPSSGAPPQACRPLTGRCRDLRRAGSRPASRTEGLFLLGRPAPAARPGRGGLSREGRSTPSTAGLFSGSRRATRSDPERGRRPAALSSGASERLRRADIADDVEAVRAALGHELSTSTASRTARSTPGLCAAARIARPLADTRRGLSPARLRHRPCRRRATRRRECEERASFAAARRRVPATTGARRERSRVSPPACGPVRSAASAATSWASARE